MVAEVGLVAPGAKVFMGDLITSILNGMWSMMKFGLSHCYGGVARNYIFSLIWRCYSPKRDVLDYWGTILYCLLSY